ncbi:glutathione S-transferase N-terminal domain-containing protein [candidate division WOR-3 bacterium]|nr:glutathione S-transferase N-terminal domain-containing protein [candidate division WOR-3 bacterium]
MPEEKKYPNVVVYSTAACPWCHRVKDYLKKKGVSFKNVQVDTDQDAAQEMVKISGQMSVPVIVIGGKTIIGFDKTKIDTALEV